MPNSAATPAADDADFQQTWMTILPLYFNRYDPNVGAAMDTATQYSAAAYNQGMGKALPTFNTLSRLSEISVPTLVVAGRHDWITPPVQGAERIHAALPQSQLVVFEESGHFPYIEENEHFVKTVSDWLATLKE